jgi:A/G-specific adenine glycosylase
VYDTQHMITLPVKEIQKAVLAWYKTNGRDDLDWRNLENQGINRPYGVMVSEFMLQQTQVERVAPKFKAFMEVFPTIESLATAPTAQVISLWSGLGYNRRALMLQKAAQTIVTEHMGVVPSDPEILKQLPGIGPYTTGAIAAFGYNVPCRVVDTNIERFFELLLYGYNKPSSEEIGQLAEQFVPKKRSADWHGALMDLMTIVRKQPTPQAQQAFLLQELHLKPTWQLPDLSHAPLKRPQQSKFKHSARYYRGKIIAFLGQKNDHIALMSELRALVDSDQYGLEQLLIGLNRDGLVDFSYPLSPASVITLPHS